MKKITRLIIALLILSVNCQNSNGQSEPVYPYSDKTNTGGWVLQEEVSDEFEGSEIDTSKWFVQGPEGSIRSRWIGRAPSQFSPGNVRLEDGKLKLAAKWEPDFDFSDKIDYTYPEVEGEGRVYENITTAAVICKNPVHYSYMEIKCIAIDASVTSSFWAFGNRQELDIFEFMGAPSKADKKFWETQFMTNVIDWTKSRDTKRVWRGIDTLDWRVADDFHVYACEWDEDYLKFYADGDLLYSVTKEEMGDAWCMKKPMWIWVDSETFPWLGLPQEADLPDDFEIEYIRVWQKGNI